MTGVVPALPRMKFTDSSGKPVELGWVTVYLAGSTTKTNTWQDKARTTLNTNPIHLDPNGEALIWLDPALTYKFLLQDKSLATVPGWPVDNILVTGESPTITTLAVDRFSGTGAQTAFVLSVTPTSENNTMVYVGGTYVQKNAYSLAGNVLTFAVAPASGTNNIEVQTIDLTDYTAVASAVSTVTANIADVQTVAGIAPAVSTTSGIAPAVSTVAGIAGSVSAVAGIAGDVSIAAGQATNIGTVADNIVNVNTVGSNMPLVSTVAQQINAALPGYKALTLAGTDSTVLAFDVAETNQAYEARKVVSGSGTYGSLATLAAGGITWGLKMCVNSLGQLQWNQHQLFKATNNLLATNWTTSNLAAPTAGQTDSDGGTTAWLLQASGTTLSVLTQSLTYNRENTFTMDWIAKKGTTDWMILRVFDGTTQSLSYVNLNTGAAGTVAAGFTLQVLNTRADGTTLPAGFWRVALTGKIGVTSLTLAIGPTNADASPTVTAGKNITVEKPHLYYGHRLLPYLENTSTTAFLNDAPYDYSTGSKRLYLEPTTTYVNNYSEDLTQVDWVATNITPAFNAVSPSGGTCSTITATLANGTILQTVAGGTARVANFFVRRKTGTGSVFITIDGGATWTDITASINSTTYTRFALAGGAGSSFGYKIATSGDALEVAFNLLFNHPLVISNETMFRAPRPVWSSSSTHATVGDQFKINSGIWTSGYTNGVTVYADYDRMPGYTGFSDNVPLRAAKTGYTEFLEYVINSSGLDGQMQTTTSVATRQTYNYLPSAGERMEITMSSGNGINVMSINGDPITTHGSVDSVLGVRPNLGCPVVDFVELASLQASSPGHGLMLRRLVVAPNYIDPRKVRLWRWSQTQAKTWIAHHEVALCAELPNTKANREVSCQIIQNDGNVAYIAVTHFQRNIEADYHNEMPARLMQRNYKYIWDTNQLVPLTDDSVAYQDPRWSLKLGHSQGLTIFQVPFGTYQGEWRAVFANQDSASGTLTGDDRSLYTMVNRRKDCHPSGWTTPVKLLDANSNAFGYGGGYILPLSNNEALIFPADHAVAPGRVCIPLYDGTNANTRVLYTDDFGGANGTNWTLGPSNVYSGPATNINEATASFWPDSNGKMGTAIYTWRTFNGAPQNQRVWGTSTNGINITYQGLMPSYQGSEVDAATLQLDPDGTKYGTAYGRIAFFRAEYRGSTSKPRQGMRVGFATDGTMTLTNEFNMFTYRDRPFGYCGAKLLEGMYDKTTGGQLVAFAVESASNGGQNDSAALLFIVPMPVF